jgi:plastocyanin
VLAVLALVGAGCYNQAANTNSSGSTNSVGSTPVATNSVVMQNISFSPRDITITQGTTVTWTNNDTITHNVIGSNGGPSSGSIAPGGTYSYTFNTVGTFPYACTFHPVMTGTVTVGS